MKIFISYATEDLDTFSIPITAGIIEKHPEIEKVFYWDRDSNSETSIVRYMEDCITESDVIITVCSVKSNESGPVQKETDMAVYLNKRIIPIFEDFNNVRISLRPNRGVAFRKLDFDNYIEELIQVITRKLPANPIEEDIVEFHGQFLYRRDFRSLYLIEKQLNIIIPPVPAYNDQINKNLIGFYSESNEVRELYICGLSNRLSSLNFFPESILSLKSLKRLDLSHNEIVIVPEGFNKLVSLEYLNLSYNEYLRIPRDFSGFSSLKNVILSGISILKNEEVLNHLDLLEKSNCVIEWKIELKRFKSHKEEIGIREMDKTGIICYKEYMKLKKLEEVVGSKLYLSDKPYNQPNAYHFNLEDEYITSIVMKKSSHNRKELVSIPKEIKEFINLKELILDGNNIGEIPDFLVKMDKLILLSLKDTSIHKNSEQELKRNLKVINSLKTKKIPCEVK